MKIKSLLLILVIFFATEKASFSKEKTVLPMTKQATLEQGTLFDVRLTNFEIIGTTKDASYGVSYVGNDVTLYEIDAKGNLKRTVESILPDYMDRKQYITNVVMVNGYIYVYTNAQDKKTEMNYFLYDEINIATLKASGKIQKLDEIKYEKRNNKGKFTIITSPNQKKILLYKTLPYEKGGKEKYEMTVFSDKMEEIWKEEFELPYLDNIIAVNRIFIDDEGDVFISAKKYAENTSTKGLSREERKKNHYYDMVLFFIRKNGKDFKEFEIDVENKWITDIRFGIANNGKIVASGFYSEKSSYGIRGVFFLSIDKETRKITKYSLKNFDVEFFYTNLSEKKKAKAMKKEEQGKGRGLLEFKFRDLIIREDGGVVLVAEQSYLVVRCTTDPKTGAQSCTYTYYSNDIVVVNINPKGDIEWAKHIPKKQISGTPYFQSHHLHVGKNKMYFIFNDNVKNFSIPEAELAHKIKPFSKKGIITMVTMDLNGNQTREVLSVKDPNGLIFVANTCLQGDENQSLIFSQKGRKKRFSHVIFN